MIKAVIFDMDGVLIAAKEWHYEALNKALALFGYTISRSDHLTTYDGLPTWRKLELLSLEHGLPVELHQFINDMKQAYTMEMVHTLCKPRFVHEYALSTLKANGYALALASNSIKQTIDTMIGHAALTDYFDLMLSADDVSKPKPHPEIYLTAIQQLGLLPSEVLIVEDNDNGIKAATASGAHVMQVETTDEVNLANIMTHVRAADERELSA